MNPGRREELLQLVPQLVGELRNAPVGLEANPKEIVASGVPRSCLGKVVSFLEARRDLKLLQRFVGRLHTLDRVAAQNPNKLRAHFHVLQKVLQEWLTEESTLGVEEWLYLLAWSQRQLPNKSGAPPQGKTSPSSMKPSTQNAWGGNQMAEQLRRFEGKR